MLQLSMVDFPLMLPVKLPVVDRIQPPQSNKFASGVENKGTGDSKLNDSPVQVLRKHVHSQGAQKQAACLFVCSNCKELCGNIEES